MVSPTNFINPTTFAPARFATIGSVLNLIIPTLLVGGGIIFFVMLILGGFRYMSSGGNAESLKKATDVLKYSAIGLFIVLLSYFLVKLIGSIFRINIPI